jgi:hypothetical protein
VSTAVGDAASHVGAADADETDIVVESDGETSVAGVAGVSPPLLQPEIEMQSSARIERFRMETF